MAEPSSPRLKRDIVLIPVDGSEFSDYAVEFYMKTIHKPDNHVVFVHSTEYKSISSPGIAVGGPQFDFDFTVRINEEEVKAKHILQKFEEKLKKEKIDGEVYHVHGEAGPGIITTANEKHADFIVIGCRGKGTVRRTLTGSVTDYVSHHAHVPVIVARHRDHIKHHHHGHNLPRHVKH